jgi:uncharacterized protein GlcG (DUF336 family)
MPRLLRFGYSFSVGALGGLTAALLCLTLSACGGAAGRTAPPEQDDAFDPTQRAPSLAAADVQAIMQAAARSLDESMAIAVTDRRGAILGVATKAKIGTAFDVDYQAQCGTCSPGDITPLPACHDCQAVNLAVQLARTASFFSADQTPLTSRSVRFLSGEHFPPHVTNTSAAALFGIENTNRGCDFDAAFPTGDDFVPGQFVPRARNLPSTLRERLGLTPLACQNSDDPSARLGCTTGIATIPGGVPIYKNDVNNDGRLVGGIGVIVRPDGGLLLNHDPVAAFDAPDGILRRDDSNPEFTLGEFAARAFAGDNTGFPDTVKAKGLTAVADNLNILPARQLPFDPVIFVDGIEIPEIDPDPPVTGVGTGDAITNFIVAPTDSAGPVATQWLIGPNASTDGLLTQDDVHHIIFDGGVSAALETRAAIRLPLEARTAMVLAVSDTNGVLIGLFRMSDATVFSIDVAVAKSRNVIYFSSPTINSVETQDCPGPEIADCRGPAFPAGTAITNRTLSFGSQPFFPSGIEATSDTALPGFQPPFAPGPFRRVFINDSVTPCTNGGLAADGGQPTNGRQNGIVFFPGSAPLYRDGVLIGGLGVSGDGVEQDDIVTVAGTQAAPDFEPPPGIRADNIVVRGVRLPYVKSNRQPDQ